ncbi:MAG: hypothetical protein GEV07_20785 [Streptosporangiales bacterium]|nr:hypothetical protein [Streptosporangiales bacterium]
MSVLSMEVTGVAQNGQQQGMNTTALIQGLRAFAGNTEGSQGSWQGAGGAAYMRARAEFLRQVDTFAGSQGRISEGIGHTARHTGTADDESYSDVSGASGEISSINTTTPVGV